MTTNPEVVNVVDTSTGTKPVTHTALVAVNKESTQVIPFTVPVSYTHLFDTIVSQHILIECRFLQMG